MNAPQHQFQNHGSAMASVAPSKGADLFNRTTNFLRGLTGQFFAFGMLFIMAEYALPEHLKPSTRIGFFHGSIESNDIAAKQSATVEYQRQLAEAQAKAQANAAIEIEVNRQQQQSVADSLTAQSTMANGADIACVAGTLIPFTGDWRGFGDLLRAGCGVSTQIRGNITNEQARAGRDGTAIQPRTVTGAPPAPAPLKPPAALATSATPRLRIAPLQP
jgi:hypothetical protein